MSAFAWPAPNVCTVKLVVTALIVPTLVLLKSHANKSKPGPFAWMAPEVQEPTSTVPQTQGVSWRLAAHCVVKTVLSVSRHTLVSLTGDASGAKTWAQVLPSGRVPAKSFALPVVDSQLPPCWATSRQPLVTAHVEHTRVGSEVVFLSCCLRQFTVLAPGWLGSQAFGGVLIVHVPAVAPVAMVQAKPAAQVPQGTVPPQPSEATPHVLVPQAVAAGVGLQTQTFALQASFALAVGQVPQPTVVVGQPAGLVIVPQLSGAGQAAWHARQWPPATQVRPVAQPPLFGPQLTVPPQPSGMEPQAWVPQTCAAVLGMQVHALGLVAVPHFSLALVVGQVPQLTVVWAQPAGFAMVPQVSPRGQVVAHATH
jgi:hypothetical protein